MIATKGINHIALVCRDMKETMKFYTQVLNMPLFKTVQLPDGGQHFFFDCGGGNAVAFFWWEDAPEAAPGIASVRKFPFDAKTAHGSMNHLAFDMEEDQLEAALERLQEAGVEHTHMVFNHDDSPSGYSQRYMRECLSARSTSPTPTASCSNSPPPPKPSGQATWRMNLPAPPLLRRLEPDAAPTPSAAGRGR